MPYVTKMVARAKPGARYTIVQRDESEEVRHPCAFHVINRAPYVTLFTFHAHAPILICTLSAILITRKAHGCRTSSGDELALFLVTDGSLHCSMQRAAVFCLN